MSDTALETPIRKGLTLRILADKSRAIERYDHETRETKLVNPDGGPWPRAGVIFVEGPPKLARIPMSTISRGIREGWIEARNERVVRAKGAPPRGRGEHVFVNADFIFIRDMEGPTRYRVTHQPGKYIDGGKARVDWFFDAELISRG